MSSRIINWFKFSSPASFYPLAGKLVPIFMVVAVILIAVGLYMSFFVAPTDYKQGEGYRIIFVHVPTAWMSMFIYLVMAFWAAMGLVFNTRLSAMMAESLAATGAMFTFLALWTGAFWGKPMWGAWWVWDARLTSELILFFLYIGYIALKGAIDDTRRGDRAGRRTIVRSCHLDRATLARGPGHHQRELTAHNDSLPVLAGGYTFSLNSWIS